jgi:hypothetical protein
MDGHGPTPMTMGGPPWDLQGILSFGLDDRAGAGAPGDSLTYTDVIQIRNVAEPSALTHVASGGLLGLMIRHGRRRKNRIRCGGTQGNQGGRLRQAGPDSR